MKPKDLKFPFSWEERSPRLISKIFYVPRYYEAHTSWKRPLFSEIFGRNGEVCVEYCSGHGHWIIEKAKENREQLWIAVEKRFERVRKIWSKRENEKIDNLLIVCGEAEIFTRHYLNQDEVSRVYINFPDPWPKKRHAKHRLIQQPFIEKLGEVIAAHGEFFMATDDRAYADQTINIFKQYPSWKSRFLAPYYSHHLENYGNSWFETLWKEKGRCIHYMHFIRQ